METNLQVIVAFLQFVIMLRQHRIRIGFFRHFDDAVDHLGAIRPILSTFPLPVVESLHSKSVIGLQFLHLYHHSNLHHSNDFVFDLLCLVLGFLFGKPSQDVHVGTILVSMRENLKKRVSNLRECCR